MWCYGWTADVYAAYELGSNANAGAGTLCDKCGRTNEQLSFTNARPSVRPASNGPNGPASNGPASNGPASNGPASNGSNGPASNGSACNVCCFSITSARSASTVSMATAAATDADTKGSCCAYLATNAADAATNAAAAADLSAAIDVPSAAFANAVSDAPTDVP